MEYRWKSSSSDLDPETKGPNLDEYKEIIRRGLPRTKNPKKIAVIGAGIAGLVSASLLADQGHKVTIFEANTRIGGRVYTIREPFTHGHYGEAGAMRLPTFYELVFEYIKKFDLPTNTFYNIDEKKNELIYVNGKRIKRKDYDDHTEKDLGYDIARWEKGYTAEELLQRSLEHIAEYLKVPHPEKHWAKVIEKYGEYSVRQYLKKETFYSEAALEMIQVLMNLESRSNLSFIQNIIEIDDHNSKVEYREITGGMDKLPKAFLKGLTEHDVKIHLDQRLIGINQPESDTKVTLSFEKTSSKSRKLPQNVNEPRISHNVFINQFEANAVILTIPFPAMRYLNVNPSFSHNKRKAIRELHYDVSTKIFLQFDRRFWEEDDCIYGGGSVTDLPSRFIYYPSHGFDGKEGGVIIASYTWGDEAKGWDSLPNELRVEYALNDVAAVHGKDIREHFVVGTSHSWLIDEYSFGEAAMFLPGQLKELQPDIPKPEGNVYFAGDATSLKHAWIEGAIESGIRVALEINENGK